MAPSIDAPWVWFLGGGILAILLFRPWIMAMTSFGGALLLLHASLCLLDPVLLGDCVPWSRAHWIMLNWVCLISAGVGTVLQFLIHRRWRPAAKGAAAKPANPGLIGRMRMLIPFRKAA
jgi:hypothetical protein